MILRDGSFLVLFQSSQNMSFVSDSRDFSPFPTYCKMLEKNDDHVQYCSRLLDHLGMNLFNCSDATQLNCYQVVL